MSNNEMTDRTRRLWQAYAAQQHKLMRRTLERAQAATGERREVLLRRARLEQRRNLANYSLGRGEWRR